MQVGINILNFGPGANPDSLLRWAKLSESLGYHSVMISDHVVITPSVRQRYPEPYYDCFTTLSWLAGQTTRIRLGTTVAVLPYRHPILVARQAGNIDQFSDGRLILGVGVGNAEDEFRALGQSHAHRGAYANESLSVMLAVWNSPSPVTFAGRYITLEEITGIETVQKPHPPIWVGGASEAALRRTVKYGDGWHPIVRSLDQLIQTDLPTLKSLAALEDQPTPAFCPRIRLDLREEPIEGNRLPGTGSIEQVRRDIETLQSLGAEHITLDWYTGDLEATRDHERGWHMIALLADQVFDLERQGLR